MTDQAAPGAGVEDDDDLMVELDLTGLKCPLPVLKTRKRLKSMSAGAVLVVRATDPASVIDFRHFCNVSEHELIASDESEGLFTYTIRCGNRPKTA